MAIHARQSQVEHDRVEFFHCQTPFGNQPVIRPFHNETRVTGQAACQPAGKFGFVFYQKDAHGRSPGRGWEVRESMFVFSL